MNVMAILFAALLCFGLSAAAWLLDWPIYGSVAMVAGWVLNIAGWLFLFRLR